MYTNAVINIRSVVGYDDFITTKLYIDLHIR